MTETIVIEARQSAEVHATPRRRRRWPYVLSCLAAAMLVAYLFRQAILVDLADFLNVGQPPSAVDVVLVLGGDATVRPFVAAAMVKAGLARRVLLPTVELSPRAADGIEPPEHELSRDVLLRRGVPAPAIVLLDGCCTSTRDEALALDRYLKSHPDTTVAVVTSNYHTRRARWIFRQELGSAAEPLIFVAAPTDGYDRTNWWQCEGGYIAYLTEYAKLSCTALGAAAGLVR